MKIREVCFQSRKIRGKKDIFATSGKIKEVIELLLFHFRRVTLYSQSMSQV